MAERSKTEKIYLTYKTRMLAEARLLKLARFHNGLMTWYSFCLIVISLLQLGGLYTSQGASLAFVATSVGLFGLSLYISGEKYAERAQEFKTCYLQLKALYESDLTEQTKLDRYNEILHLFENQTDADFDEMVFDATKRGQELYDSKGQIALTAHTSKKVRRKKLSRLVCAGLLIAGPVAIVAMVAALVPSQPFHITPLSPPQAAGGEVGD